MTILDYIATHPGCSGGEIAAALNTPTTAINAELRQLWRGGLVIAAQVVALAKLEARLLTT